MLSARTFLSCFLLLTLTGCAGYKLGPSSGIAPKEMSVEVMPFYNQTLEPRLSDAVMSQLRKEFQRDGTFDLATSGSGDIIISGVLTKYDRRALSFISSDVETVQDYRVTLTAQVTAKERSTGKVLLDRPVNGYTLIRVGNDLVSTERQALPLLAQDLARRITTLLADGSW
jgi:hypothetical protein